MVEMATKELNFLLLGKTGHGKSATGNLMLGEKIFKKSSNTTSETKDVKSGVAEVGSYKLNVVDGPGLEDTDLTPVEDTEAAMTNVEKALALCYGGVDAFLFVFRFGNRFTHEERKALDGLKQIFGEKFMEYVIVVVTGEDLFEKEMEDGGFNNFEQWCRKQTGAFCNLCTDCKGRVVIVNNFEKDTSKRHKQVERIVQQANNLFQSKGRYTSECFKKAEKKREKLILEQNAPILKKEFQEKICLLNTDISRFSADRTNIHKARIENRIKELRKEIEKHDKGYGVLTELSSQLNTVESNLHDTVKLKELTKELEELRHSTNTWASVGSGLIQVGYGISRVFPIVGGGVAVIGGVAYAGAYIREAYTGNRIKNEMEELEKKNSNTK